MLLSSLFSSLLELQHVPCYVAVYSVGEGIANLIQAKKGRSQLSFDPLGPLSRLVVYRLQKSHRSAESAR